MKLIDLRKELKDVFHQQDIDIVDVDFIISEVLNTSRTELILIDEVDKDAEKEIRQCIQKRLDGIPVDKIFQKAYFYGYEFKVDENVLSPRPESELLVENAIKYIKENQYNTALDLCTGSGCLAIAIKKNCNIDMTASDVSNKALQIAKYNAKQNDVDIRFVRSDMFDKIDESYDIIVSNPPYIDTDEIDDLSREVVEHDPYIALDGGEMGLKYYNIIHENLRKHLNDGGILIVEIGEDQREMIQSLYNDLNLLEVIQDYAGNDRVMVFRK
ncbi:MAG: peptide chain release factor N(5)-glutamine methyltransferase [Clostridiales bacterium]|nr:peptide chain release factor N(5)-glutamine methyltransferase [Clostridiales bacterium]